MTTITNKSKPKDRNTNVRMKVLKCENCGAPITPDAVGCEYCGASFVIEEGVPDIDIPTAVSDGIMTPNEARRYLNLDSVEEVYSAYDSDGMLIKQIIKENTPSETERYLKEGIMSKDEIVKFLNLDEPEDPHVCPIRRLDENDNPTLKDWLDAWYFVFTGKEKV